MRAALLPATVKLSYRLIGQKERACPNIGLKNLSRLETEPFACPEGTSHSTSLQFRPPRAYSCDTAQTEHFRLVNLSSIQLKCRRDWSGKPQLVNQHAQTRRTTLSSAFSIRQFHNPSVLVNSRSPNGAMFDRTRVRDRDVGAATFVGL